MTIKSQPLDFAVSITAVAGGEFGTCKSSTDIPICSAIARASSSTLPARCLQAASKRSTSSGEGIHPEASTGSGSVTVMTVTLAFKAFAKAIPCVTPFLARSDLTCLPVFGPIIAGKFQFSGMCDSGRWTRKDHEEIEVYGGADCLHPAAGRGRHSGR